MHDRTWNIYILTWGVIWRVEKLLQLFPYVSGGLHSSCIKCGKKTNWMLQSEMNHNTWMQLTAAPLWVPKPSKSTERNPQEATAEAEAAEEHRVSNPPLPSSRQCLSCDAWLKVKREDNQNCSVLCCVRQLCTSICTQMRAVLTVLWTRFCHTGPISLCVDLFVFVFCVFLFHTAWLLYYCERSGVDLMGLKSGL